MKSKQRGMRGRWREKESGGKREQKGTDRGLQAGWHGRSNPDLCDRPLAVSPPPPPSGCSVAFFIPSRPVPSLSLPRSLSLSVCPHTLFPLFTLAELHVHSLCFQPIFSSICSLSPSPWFGEVTWTFHCVQRELLAVFNKNYTQDDDWTNCTYSCHFSGFYLNHVISQGYLQHYWCKNQLEKRAAKDT